MQIPKHKYDFQKITTKILQNLSREKIFYSRTTLPISMRFVTFDRGHSKSQLAIFADFYAFKTRYRRRKSGLGSLLTPRRVRKVKILIKNKRLDPQTEKGIDVRVPIY